LTDSQIDEILDPRLRASRNAARDLVRSHVEQHSMPAEPRNTQESSGIGPEMLTIADVCKLTTLSKSTIYQLVKDEKFPLHFKLGANSRWWKSDVLAWITERAKNGRN
jgi:excisionase family DNA binding protein